MTKLQELMREIVKFGPISKKELQERTGISWGMVSTLINQLVEDKFVVADIRKSTDVGRKAEEFDVNPSEHLSIGIDLSQNGLLGVVTDLRGRVVTEQACTFENPTKELVLEEVYKMVDSFLAAYKGKTFWGIGFSVQGIVEIYEGVSALISGIKGWKNVCLRDLLEARYGLPTYTEHDPNCVMLAERSVGCLRNKQVTEATLLSFAPRVGAGISVTTRGRLCHGVRGRAGEIGCNPVDITPEGKWHHFEDYLSPNAFTKEYRRQTGKEITYPEFEALLREGDSVCEHIYRQLGKYFGFALAVANNYLNPEYIVLSIEGERPELLAEEITNLVRAVSFDPEVKLLLSQQRPEMKAIGAAIISTEKAVASL